MQKESLRENKMGVMPVGRLLASMALPMAASMLIQALYNIVDSMYVSQISEKALTALSLAFPIQNFMIAVASGTAVGVNALLSRSLGRKDFPEANRAAENGVFLALLGAVGFCVFGLVGARPFFAAQTTDLEIVEAGTTYLSIVSIASFGLFGEIMFERLLQSTGRTIFAMFSQTTGAVINIVLDPILIFGWFGLPAMGVSGAALATVIGQVAAMCLSILYNFKKNHDIRLHFARFRPSFSTIRMIYVVGIPSILMMTIGSVMTYGINQILLAFTSTAAAVFGVYFKLQSFVFMPVFGLNNGMVPIIAYNYGAGNRGRIMRTFLLSAISATGMMILGFTAFQLFPVQLLGLFNPSPELIAIGVPALRIISYSFLFAGYCIVAGSVFQALGNGVYSLIVSIARQLVMLLPVAYLFSLSGVVDRVWLAFPIAEIASVLLSTLLLVRIYKKRIKPLPR